MRLDRLEGDLVALHEFDERFVEPLHIGRFHGFGQLAGHAQDGLGRETGLQIIAVAFDFLRLGRDESDAQRFVKLLDRVKNFALLLERFGHLRAAGDARMPLEDAVEVAHVGVAGVDGLLAGGDDRLGRELPFLKPLFSHFQLGPGGLSRNAQLPEHLLADSPCVAFAQRLFARLIDGENFLLGPFHGDFIEEFELAFCAV